MRFILIAAAALVGAATPALAQASLSDPAISIWMNPHNSVAVRTAACAGRLCGWVVWASADALADARDSDIKQLLGTKLLEDYERRRDGNWSGTVFVPDMGRRFSSTITQDRPDRLTIRGCLIGGFFCRSQVWTRIGQVPHD